MRHYIYRPRMVALLYVPVAGTREERTRKAVSKNAELLRLTPTSAYLEINDHNQADGLDVTFDWHSSGIDPRILNDAVVQLHIDNAPEDGLLVPSERNCRFVGLTKDISVSREETDADVTIRCVDYTTLFLEAKPFGSAGIPAYTQTLEEAWRTIVKQTPGAQSLADRLVFEGEGVRGDLLLGAAVSDRFRKLAKVPAHPDTDAWAVWQQCVGMLGLVSYMRLDQCVVTTATNLYTEHDAPVFLWGQNVLSWDESVASAQATKGIAVTSYDANSGRAIEAFYPPADDPKVKRKRAAASPKTMATPEMPVTEEREFLQYPGVTNQGALDVIARRIYEERSRQELEGHLTTAFMRVDTESGKGFDLLTLKAGDSVRVQLEDVTVRSLGIIDDVERRKQFLVGQGYAEDVALLVAKNADGLGKLDTKFIVKAARVVFEVFPDSINFEVEIDYVNRIQLTGDTA